MDRRTKSLLYSPYFVRTIDFVSMVLSTVCRLYAAMDENLKYAEISSLPDDLLLLCLAKVPWRSLPVIRTVCKRWHFLAEPLQIFQIRKAKGFAEAVIFIIGNEYTNLSYQGLCARFLKSCGNEGSFHAVVPDNGSPITCLTSPLRLQLAVVGADCEIFAIGGRAPILSFHPSTCVVYSRLDSCNVLTNVWTKRQCMNVARFGFAAAAFLDPVTKKTKIIVVGGYDSTGEALRSAEIYCSTSDSWIFLPNCQKIEGACRGQVIDGNFLVKQLNSFGYLEIFDFGKNEWFPQEDVGQLHGFADTSGGKYKVELKL